MQLPDVPIPSGWTDRILTALIGLVGGGTIYKVLSLIVNKGKRKSELALSDAQAESAWLDVFAKARTQLDQLQQRLNHVEARSDQREVECREQIHLLQATLNYNRQMLSAYMRRCHEFAGEVSKLVLFSKNQEIDLATATEKLRNLQSHADGDAAALTELMLLITPQEFRIRTADEIYRQIPLPKAPIGVEPLSDSGERERPNFNSG